MVNKDQVIADALKVLKEGGLILYPTDTIWGIGCDATNPDAVAKVYALKKRSDSKSLVLLACDMDMVARYIKEIPNIAIDLVEVNDKPMTIVYPGAITSDKPDRYHLAHNTVAQDGSVGIRVPLMDFCKDLVYKFGRPVVSTSANISGEPSPTEFGEISEAIRAGVDYIVPAALDAESTGLASQIIKVGLGGEVEIIRQ